MFYGVTHKSCTEVVSRVINHHCMPTLPCRSCELATAERSKI